MSVKDMLIQYNDISEEVESEPNYLREKDPVLFSMEPGTAQDLVEVGLVEDFSSSSQQSSFSSSTQRSSLKRKSEATDFASSSKVRAVSGIASDLYESFPQQHSGPTTSSECEQKIVAKNSSTHKTTSGKKKKNDLTIEWLEENYMLCEGVCLARCILYSHYRDFCEKNGLEPSCAATFGKTIRQKFPKVTTRRLGTRGHSKYHYYGIGIRETSIYYNSVYAGKGLTRYSPKTKTEENPYFTSKASGSKEKFHSFLEDVPSISHINWKPGSELLVENMQMFVNVYKQFCEDILKAAQMKNFKLLSTKLLQLWSDLPFEQFVAFIHNSVVMDMISHCDVLLYEALLDALLPIPCDDIDERLILEVGNAVKQWDEYLKSSLPNPPSGLVGKKRTLAQHFAQIMLRHVSFIKLYRTVQAIFGSVSTFVPMRNDLEKISLQNSIGTQSFYSSNNEENKDAGINTELLKEMKELLQKNPNVETLISWLDSVVDSKVIKPTKQNGRSMKKRAQDFLLKWSFFGARITHNLNNTSAASFNSFQYLRMFLVEYVMLAIETQFSNEKHQEIRRTVAKHIKNQKPTQHASGSRNNKNSWNTKQPNYPLAGHSPADPANSGSLKRWETYGNWHPGHSYDALSIPEMAMSSHLHNQYEIQPSGYYPSIPTQTYPALNYAPLTYTSFQQEDQNEFHHKREALAHDNVPTFTYLNGPASAKSEHFPTISFNDGSSGSYNPDFIHGIGNSSKAIGGKFEYPDESSPYMGPNDNFLKVPNTSLCRSPNLSPYSAKMDLSPISSAHSPMSSHSPFHFPHKQKDETFKESVQLIQDLSHSSYPGNSQNIYKEFVGNSASKVDFKLHQLGGYRLGDDPTALPINVNRSSSPFAYDFTYYDSPTDSHQHCFPTHDDALMWSGTFPLPYLEKSSSQTTRSGHHVVFQENLPSISSVLSTE